MSDVDVLQHAEAIVGEGPAWDARTSTLWWVDILGCTGHWNDLNGRTGSFTIDRHLGAILPSADEGELLLMVRDGFQVRGAEGGIRDLALPLTGDPAVRFNDGKVDPRGRAFGGTMAYDWQHGRALGALFRLDGSSVATIESDVRLANGLGWSPDGTTFYFVDSGAQTVHAYDYDLDAGIPRNRRVFAEVPAALGLPDGLAVDDEGCVWIAVHGAGEVRRYTPEGECVRTMPLPATQVTSLCFAGADRTSLVVTSARLLLDEAELERQPLAGSVFVFDAGVSGPPATPWQP